MEHEKQLITEVDKMIKKQFPLRLDPKLYTSLERWASDEFRSVNAHIEFLLSEASRRAGRLTAPDISIDSNKTDV